MGTAPYGTVEKIEGGYLYTFMTPWVAPIELIEKLIEIHKGLDFELRYIYPYTDESGVFYGSKCRPFVHLELNNSNQSRLYEKVLADSFEKYKKAFSIFG